MVLGLVFMFCALGLVFGGTDGIRSHFYVLRSRARFRRYGGRLVSISCFAQPYSFLALPSALTLDFMFCAPELVFYGIEGVGSCFHVLRSRARF
jgi:hypothetical protein